VVGNKGGLTDEGSICDIESDGVLESILPLNQKEYHEGNYRILGN
jgi:hypothetical protein